MLNQMICLWVEQHRHCISLTGCLDLLSSNRFVPLDIWVCVGWAQGVLSASDSQKMHIVQAVRELYEIVDGALWDVEDKRLSRLVVIGRRLNQEDLQASFVSNCCPGGTSDETDCRHATEDDDHCKTCPHDHSHSH